MSKYVHRFNRNTTGRDLIVGDIHGHFTKLAASLDAIGFDPKMGDRLFSVGDLVDRGPESMLSLEWLLYPWFHPVSGNHESMAVDFDAGQSSLAHYAANGGEWNIGNDAEDRRRVASAFAELPIAIEIDTAGGLIGIVHADCPAPSCGQFTSSLESELISDGEREGLIAMAQWSRHRCNYMLANGVDGVRAVVVGHTSVDRMMALGNVIFIDTGAWLGYEFCIIDAKTLLKAEAPLIGEAQA